VHDTVFPISEATALPDTGSLAAEVREMVNRIAALLTTARWQHRRRLVHMSGRSRPALPGQRHPG
jgi:hypothetical protein